MQLTSIHCRTQEIVQRDRANSASLDNVRIIAERAAAAWGCEALLAEKREARHLRAAALAAKRDLANSDREESPFSENPGRGFARD
jgi:hypothetical protein